MTGRRLEFLIPGDLTSATGGYVYDRRLIEGLRERDWRVTVHALDRSFPYPTATALSRAAQVWAALPDGALVLIDGLALGAMPELVAAHAARLSLVALIHLPLGNEVGTPPALAARLTGQEQRALRQVHHVIATSHGSARALEARGVPAQSLSVIEPGTDVAALAPRDEAQVLRLLCVATIQEGKGHELLIEALAPLAHLSWRLSCVGSLRRSPSSVQRLRARLVSAGLRERVDLVGEVPHHELAAYYRSSDLFVLATQSESYGMAVAEALAHALPVISTRTGAIAQLVGTEAGIVLEPGDGRALHAALTRVLREPALRAELARGARAAGSRLPRWSHTCQQLAATLERLASRRAAPITA